AGRGFGNGGRRGCDARALRGTRLEPGLRRRRPRRRGDPRRGRRRLDLGRRGRRRLAGGGGAALRRLVGLGQLDEERLAAFRRVDTRRAAYPEQGGQDREMDGEGYGDPGKGPPSPPL